VLDSGQYPEAQGEHERGEREERRPGEKLEGSPQSLHRGVNVYARLKEYTGF
jgi:hypothetical protein